MTLNDLERRNSLYFEFFFTEFDSFAGRLCHRPVMSVEILSPSSSLPLLAKTNAPYSAVFLR